MNQMTSSHKAALRKVSKTRRTKDRNTAPPRLQKDENGIPVSTGNSSQIRVICLYPSVLAGKLARHWIESALQAMDPNASGYIEYFNYAVLSHGAISWEHVIGRIRPDIILIVGDGHQTLGSGLRHSLRELISRSNGAAHPMVIFRDLEPEPTLNTQVLLDYISALTRRNHCELSAMNGNGTPIDCFGYRHLLLQPRKHHE